MQPKFLFKTFLLLLTFSPIPVRSQGCALSTVIGPCLENSCPGGYACDLTSQMCCVPKTETGGCKKRKRRNVWRDKRTAEEAIGKRGE
uniref:Uncharacterized protein n=1 Tax=Globodera rostochiensis TaxID=31243 RepID=A0A914HUY6_GLORO